MKKFHLTRIVTSAVVALGLLFGLLPPGLPKASANVADYTFTNNTGRTVRDLHIDFNRIGHLVPDDGPWGPFSSGEPGKDDSATNKMHLWDGQVAAGGTATIRVSLEGNGDWTRFAWTFNGEKPRNWINNPDVRNTQALISRALTAVKNDQLRARLSALGPGPVGDINFVIEKNVPRELAKLAESAREMRDPAATALAEVVALLNKLIVVVERDGFQGTTPPEASPAKEPVKAQPAARPEAAASPAPAPGTGAARTQPAASAGTGDKPANTPPFPKAGEPAPPLFSLDPVPGAYVDSASGRVYGDGVLRLSALPILGKRTLRSDKEKPLYIGGQEQGKYRIKNSDKSMMPVIVTASIGGQVVATADLEPGETIDVVGDNIKVKSAVATTDPNVVTATVFYDAVP